MIQSEAKKRNHSNVSTGVGTTNIVNRHREESKGNPSSRPKPEIGRNLKTIAAMVSCRVPTKETTMSLSAGGLPNPDHESSLDESLI